MGLHSVSLPNDFGVRESLQILFLHFKEGGKKCHSKFDTIKQICLLEKRRREHIKWGRLTNSFRV